MSLYDVQATKVFEEIYSSTTYNGNDVIIISTCKYKLNIITFYFKNKILYKYEIEETIKNSKKIDSDANEHIQQKKVAQIIKTIEYWIKNVRKKIFK